MSILSAGNAQQVDSTRSICPSISLPAGTFTLFLDLKVMSVGVAEVPLCARRSYVSIYLRLSLVISVSEICKSKRLELIFEIQKILHVSGWFPSATNLRCKLNLPLHYYQNENNALHTVLPSAEIRIFEKLSQDSVDETISESIFWLVLSVSETQKEEAYYFSLLSYPLTSNYSSMPQSIFMKRGTVQ
jgi:hypothetical protein